jgi:hypothetical protein
VESSSPICRPSASQIHGTVFVGGFGLISAESLIANTGMGACGDSGAAVPGARRRILLGLGGADDVHSRPEARPLAVQGRAGSAAARAGDAAAGVTTTTVAAGTDIENIGCSATRHRSRSVASGR